MSIIIEANGSKFAGEKPDSLIALHQRLKKHPLDKTFEDYGNFVQRLKNGRVALWGNFADISAVFSIYGSRKELAKTIRLIRENQKTLARERG